MRSIGQLTGRQNLDRIILVTMSHHPPQKFWDGEREKQDQDAKSLFDKHWQPMRQKGSQIMKFDQTPESAAKIMQVLAVKPGRVRLQ